MTIQKGIEFNYRFEGELVPVNRSHFASVEDWKAIADHMLVDGRYAADLAREFGIDKGQTIVNSFREGSSGIKWLLKRIIEDGVVPIDSFWRHEVGRDVEFELNKRGLDRPQQGEVVAVNIDAAPIDAEVEVIAAQGEDNRPDPVATEEPQREEKRWSDVLKEQIDQIDEKLDKIEAYDRTLAFVKDWLADREAKNPHGVMVDVLNIILEEMTIK